MPVQETVRTSSDVSNGEYAPSPVPKPVIALFAALRKVFGRAEDGRETIHNPPTVDERGTWNIEVVVESDAIDGGFVAETPDIPGALAQGETEEEAVENLIDAIHGIVAAKVEEHFRELDLDMPTGAARRFSVHL